MKELILTVNYGFTAIKRGKPKETSNKQKLNII